MRRETPRARSAGSPARSTAWYRAFADATFEIADAARLTEVDVAGQLAQDQDVETRHHLGPQRRSVGELRKNRRGTEIGEQVQLLPEPEDRLLGPLFARQRIVLRTADRAEQDRVRSFCERERRLGYRVSGGIVGGAADRCLLQLEHEALRPEGIEHFDRLGNDLRTDAIAGKNRDFHGSSRTARAARSGASPRTSGSCRRAARSVRFRRGRW